MRRHLDAVVTELSTGWRLETDSGEVDAAVPGTVAAALNQAGLFDPANPIPLQDRDWWYRCRLNEPAGPAVLRLGGLATLAEIFLNGSLIGRSDSMYVALDLAVELTGEDELAIRFHALTEALAAKGPRALWRPRLLDDQGLRLVRTTLLGHMPGWAPTIQAVGPYRPVRLIRPGRISIDQVRIAADLTEDGDGLLAVSAENVPAGLVLRCAGVEAAFVGDGERSIATLVVPRVQAWWPSTHGTPALYDLEVVLDGEVHPLARTGFRHLEVSTGDAFGIAVNGVPIFCRGAVWTNADLLTLAGDRATYLPLLQQLVDAGANLLRVPGIATYEAPAFFELCDELGLLVFADFMFANFDYPAADPTWLGLVETEVRQFLQARQGNPSLAVCSAGSEIAQQASMLGLPPQRWYSTLATDVLPGLVAEWRPDLGYVPGSPSGGPVPFSPDGGVGHYYGVGAYERPLEDARRANVGFATECLAFANLSDDDDLDLDAGVPQDPGTDWDFADTRNHYVERLYDLDRDQLRADAPLAFADFGRAAVAEVATETFTEWRRAGSSCRGALIFHLADLEPGAGWGVLDSTHRPKSIFRALARVWRPVWLGLTDEGTNGLRVQLANDTADAVSAELELFGLRDGTVVVARATAEVTLEPRSTTAINATDLYGGFFDYTYAYRFGAPELDVSVARLRVDGEVVSEAFGFPQGRPAALAPATLQAEVHETPDGWTIHLTTDRFAQSVHLHVPGFAVADDWFHVVPGGVKVIEVRPLPPTALDVRPTGVVRALAGTPVRF
jgi:beta-mannosidase